MEDDIPRGDRNQGAAQAPPIPNFPQGHSNPTRVTTGADLRRDFIKDFKDKRQWSRVSAEPEPAQRRALVIAISYGNRSPPQKLLGTYVDAYRVIRMLENTFGYSRSNICILADILDDADGKEDKLRWPSKTTIKDGLRWLVHGTKNQDYRFLFFAGHGHRQSTKSGGSVEGILPSDIDYYREEDDTVPLLESTANDYLVPDPRRVLWDHKFNEILAGSLGAGAKLTVVFDCCHSGGTLNRANPKANDQSENVNARTGKGATGGIEARVLLQASQGVSSEPWLSGNMLALPHEEDMKTRSTSDPGEDLVQPRTETSPLQSQRKKHTIGDVLERVYDFDPSCRVICWAACADIQLAFEYGLPMLGGVFCKAFTDHMKNRETNYRLLNRHIDGVLQQYNEARRKNTLYKEKGKGKNWDNYPDHEKYQHAKLFTSANMGDGTGENQFEYRVDL